MDDRNYLYKERKHKADICLKRKDSRQVDRVIESLNRDEVWVSVSKMNEELDQLGQLEGVTRVAKINIMSRTILNYDKANLRDEYLNDNFQDIEQFRDVEYYPYFTSFIVYMNATSTSQQINQLREMGSRWFIARLIFKDEIDNQLGKMDVFFGELENSASPIKYKKRLLQISSMELDNNTVDEIYNLYRIPTYTKDSKVERDLQNLFANVTLETSRVYSVGNGNMIQIGGQTCITSTSNIKTYKEFQMIYDVGYHQRSYPNEKRIKYGVAVRDFHKIVPDAVFLSHWDDDHIMGCVYAQKELYDCQWFAPELSEDKYRNKSHDKYIEINAVRLATFLGYKGKLTIIRRDVVARKLVEVTNGNNKIAFYLGENRHKGTITIENCGGLVIEIINDDGKGSTVDNLFCGDVPYEALKMVVWDKRLDGYANLVVPHHGSVMNCSALKTTNVGLATICAIDDQSKDRPNKNHQETLENKTSGYKVQVTQNAPKAWYDLKLV